MQGCNLLGGGANVALTSPNPFFPYIEVGVKIGAQF